jgi:hypothetical protein
MFDLLCLSSRRGLIYFNNRYNLLLISLICLNTENYNGIFGNLTHATKCGHNRAKLFNNKFVDYFRQYDKFLTE